MTQVGEAAFVGINNSDDPVEEKEEDGVERVRIRFGIFFDGTLNNRTNIDQRLVSSPDSKLTDEERKDAAELKKNMSAEQQSEAADIYKKHGAKKEDDETSYDGGYTNIVKMERYIDDAPKYDLTLTTYIEGSGTMKKSSDEMMGSGFGMGKSGVPKKVNKGVLEVVSKITQQVDADNIIECLTLDVFGFSRGAAGARYFIFQALKGDNPVLARLKEKGYTVKKVEVCFAGLYDTVSTYGLFIIAGFADNVEDLELKSVRHAKKVVQLAAADEHRKYFSLTSIQSSGYKGREIFLPGVHSDIGGGYRDKAEENQEIFYGVESDAIADRDRLIASGWYKQDEIDLITHDEEEGDFFTYATLSVLRPGIRSQYSRIPLHIMARFARESEISIITNLERDEEIPSGLDTLKQRIDAHIDDTDPSTPSAKKSTAEHWQHNEHWLRDLRHDYFHFSARIKTWAHDPRFSGGRRHRKTYNG